MLSALNWKKWLRIRLSTWVVAVLTASALVGINVRPYAFYFPRPPWVAELKDFVVDQNKPDPMIQCGLYGWPAPAYPSWNWFGNGVPEGQFPALVHYTAEMSDAHIACNFQQWNKRALIVDGVANAIVFTGVMLLWFATRKLVGGLKSVTFWRRWLRFELSTWIVAMLTASALLGLNIRSAQNKRPPEWLEIYCAVHPNEIYGWPWLAYPTYSTVTKSWSERMKEDIFFQNRWNGYGDAHLFWNLGALIQDILFNLLILVIAVTLWRTGLTIIKKFSIPRNTAARSYI